MEQDILIALGANMPSKAGPPVETISQAIRHMPEDLVKISGISRFYHTPCFPRGAGPDYVNAVIHLRPSHPAVSPEILLGQLHVMEADFGRERELRWGRRTLDLDLIAFGSRVVPDIGTYSHWQSLPADAQMREAPTELVLPHPRIADRAFVLVPLLDVLPGWCHPVTGLTAREMARRLPREDLAEVTPLSGNAALVKPASPR